MEQDTGVEPAFTAWEAVVLPIYESCVAHIIADPRGKCNRFLSAILRLGIWDRRSQGPGNIGAGIVKFLDKKFYPLRY